MSPAPIHSLIAQPPSTKPFSWQTEPALGHVPNIKPKTLSELQQRIREGHLHKQDNQDQFPP